MSSNGRRLRPNSNRNRNRNRNQSNHSNSNNQQNRNRNGNGNRNRNGNRPNQSNHHQSSNSTGDNCYRQNLEPGKNVSVIKKEHQPTGQETFGTVSRILTNSNYHPRGIKVMLTSGVVGRVTIIHKPNDDISTNENSLQQPPVTSSLSLPSTSVSASTSASSRPLPSFADHIKDNRNTVVDDNKLASIIEMGFDPICAAKALQKHSNHVNRAIQELITST